jgi:hypothetical protein
MLLKTLIPETKKQAFKTFERHALAHSHTYLSRPETQHMLHFQHITS